MQLLQDGVIAALAAIGLAATVWLIVTAVTVPRVRPHGEIVAVIPACGTAESLEYSVRFLESERCAGCFSRIVIVDCGMDAQAQRTAQLLCRERFDVTVCAREALGAQFD